MDSREYVLNHNFGYGNDGKIIKLNLRDLQDLKNYLEDVSVNVWGGEKIGDKIKLLDGKKFVFEIDEISKA